MHPEIAKTLTEQRRGELTEYAAGSRRSAPAGPGWLSRHLPRWHVSWSRTVLSAAGESGPSPGSGPSPEAATRTARASADRPWSSSSRRTAERRAAGAGVARARCPPPPARGTAAG